MSSYKIESLAVGAIGLTLAILVGIHVASAVAGALQKATSAFEQATQVKPVAR